jgi:cyclopropane-fatty-acyl-phospholipid synthase
LQNWATYEPESAFDAITSVGAFEHFAKREESHEEKLSVYRDFFQRCKGWLRPDGRMTLQTIAFGEMRREDAIDFMNDRIFPESDLPFLADILQACAGQFEIVMIRNDRLHYARTMDEWCRRLRARSNDLSKVVGLTRVKEMEQFFRLASVGFRAGKLHLYRLALRPIVAQWSVMGSDYLAKDS